MLVCRKDAKAAICYRLPVTVCSFVCLQKAVLLIIYERIPMMVMVCCSFAFSHFLHSSFCDLPKRYGAIRQNVAFHSSSIAPQPKVPKCIVKCAENGMFFGDLWFVVDVVLFFLNIISISICLSHCWLLAADLCDTGLYVVKIEKRSEWKTNKICT